MYICSLITLAISTRRGGTCALSVLLTPYEVCDSVTLLCFVHTAQYYEARIGALTSLVLPNGPTPALRAS